MQALFFADYTPCKTAMGHRIRAKKRKHLPFAPGAAPSLLFFHILRHKKFTKNPL